MIEREQTPALVGECRRATAGAARAGHDDRPAKGLLHLLNRAPRGAVTDACFRCCVLDRAHALDGIEQFRLPFTEHRVAAPRERDDCVRNQIRELHKTSYVQHP